MQFQLLAGPEWLGSATTGEPLVLLGDFNSLPSSPAFQLVAQQLRNVRTLVSPTPSLKTFPTRLPLLAVDHILVNECFGVESVSVVRNATTKIASDHFPLVADLRRT
jgi:endonuclease/exonuclease/phosphatase family metal-dependent hydrolase